MIRLEKVSMVYGNGVVGLHSLDLTLERGSVTVLLGQSGAGKSTLLRCLNLLNLPTTGRLTVEGLGEIRGGRLLREHRRRTGMIFQSHQLIGRQSALDNVLVGRVGYHPSLRGLFPPPRAEARRGLLSLERVGLLTKAFTRVDNLSGGQRQRVGIARALVQEPTALLADEPVASLDPVTSDHILSILRTICREDGIPVVVSLHQVELARRFAHRIIGLAGGRIVFDGSPEGLGKTTLKDIYQAPALAA